MMTKLTKFLALIKWCDICNFRNPHGNNKNKIYQLALCHIIAIYDRFKEHFSQRWKVADADVAHFIELLP
jgi:hypothetical protein